MSQSKPKRVAIIGARGIGRYHAQWWSVEGAEVCAVAGTTQSTAEAAAMGIQALVPFDGATYTTVSTMLDEQTPDIVDVCSPPELHYEHVKACLERGCDVLCEKPFVANESWTPQARIDHASELFDLAHSEGLQLSVCTQYAALMPALERLWREERPGDKWTYFKGHLQTPARGRLPQPMRIWEDLAAHLLSALYALAPGGVVDWDSLATHFEGYGARALFDLVRPDGERIKCDVVARNSAESGRHIRYFQFNDFSFNIEGARNRGGIYEARVATLGGLHEMPDAMHSIIAAFVDGTPVVDRDNALQTLEMLARIGESAKPGVNVQTLRRTER